MGEPTQISEYFSLNDYVSKIKIEDFVKEHIDETAQNFNEYLRQLLIYDRYAILYFWIDSLYKEIYSSNLIENEHDINPLSLGDYFFDTLRMSRNRIHELHQKVMENADTEVPIGAYRAGDVSIVGLQAGQPIVHYIAPPAHMVGPFMKSFMRIYNHDLGEDLENIFIKPALMHMLFIKIHPYGDGNGRTARMIHNIRFTQSFNRFYGMRLKISPLNISQNIFLNQYTYADRLNAVQFDGKTEDNYAINRWFDFVIYMVDEQLNYIKTLMKKYQSVLANIPNELPEGEKEGLQKKLELCRIKRKI